MANVKNMKVLTPETTDGTTLAYDENRQPKFKETIVPETARTHFESLNSRLPEHLKHILVALDENGVEVAATSVTGKKAKTSKAPKVEKNDDTDETTE